MAGWITIPYTIQAWASGSPQVEVERQVSARSWVFIFPATESRWLFQWRVGSSHTPRMRMAWVGLTTWAPIWMVASRLCLVRRRVKCMSSYFSGANCAPCCLAHQSHWAWASVSRWQLPSVESPQAIRVTSSTNPRHPTPLWGLVHCSSSSAL